MSLNKFMHPRNRYKNSKPSFLQLALKYPEFRAHITQDDSGKVLLDFKNADALRALTTCLLKEDFDLSVELPADRLVPTLPLRLNYIHWLEDIVGINEHKWGIDVGTGSSCIYPLLAAKMNKWHFLATEADPENAFYANKHVTANGFQDLIHVKQVSTGDILIAPLQSFTATVTFDFCMCNPPFFADHMEAQALTTTRSVDRPEASSLSTASPQECIAQGGEVGFIRQMIEESTVLRDKIKVYTSMVGKKSSLVQLKAELLHQKVPKFSTTKFCQGNTMRWGIAWTYDDSVTFPRSEFDSRKEKPPIQFMVPRGAGGVAYKVHEIAAYLRQILESIKVHCYQGKKAKSYTSITLTATENTWSHQRRLRRQQKREQTKGSHEIRCQDSKVKDSLEITSGDVSSSKRDDATIQTDKSEDVTSTDNRKSDAGSEAKNDDRNRKRRAETSTDEMSEAKQRAVNEGCEVEGKAEPRNVEKEMTGSSSALASTQIPSTASDNINGDIFTSKQKSDLFSSNQISPDVNGASKEEENMVVAKDSSPKEYILKCVMRLKRMDEQVQLELEWLDGQSRELMYQIMTFLKNKLTQSKK